MLRRITVSGVRNYRTKGAKNKKSLAGDGATSGAKRSARTTFLEDAELPSPSNLQRDPSQFTTIHTAHGWVPIPKKCYSFKWTKEQLEHAVSNRYGAAAPTVSQMQQVACDWAATVDTSTVPKTEKPTARDLAQVKEDALYRSQLKFDIYDLDGNKNGAVNKRPFLEKTMAGTKTVVRGTVNFTHAWNYFYSITYPQYSDLPQGQGTKRVSALWNEMKMDEKEVYRQKYADLLKEGKDIYKGKIVTIEEKMRINKTFNKYKETQRAKAVARQEKIDQMMADAAPDTL